ncbi:thiol reductant ABC exporter subunit CydC [Rarobacter incanus]|uniref:Thiol reductant ABC exporter CydC subunit n=1 Tax=Rarobacter incanus TaxID=153494 RepID=A0A542SPR0_9MICO|nr:thiol reductant ABC exporter subunit CydC [Rarobacter incanus]TQK76558.1 thiol reductant ABC exporter CydC subunit [Rarobacter incanus]
MSAIAADRPAQLSRRELSRWLLAHTRHIVAPLGVSVLMRALGLAAGAALIGVAAHSAALAVTGGITLRRAAAMLIALALFKAVCRYLEQFFGHLVAFKALAYLRAYFFDRLEPQAPAATEGRQTGDLLSRATRDVDRVEVFFAHTLGPAVTAVVVPLAGVVWVIAVTSPAVGLVVALGWLAIGLVWPMLGSGRALRSAAALRAARGTLAQHMTDTVQGRIEVVAARYELERMRELDDLGDQVGGDQQRLGQVVAARRGLIAATSALLLGAIIVVAQPQVGAGHFSWQTLVLVVGVVIGMLPALTAVEEFSADLDQAFASAARLVEVTEGAVATPAPAHPVAMVRPVRGEVCVDEVTFAYPRSIANALTDVSVRCAPGTVTAIVGASGSGKSTLARLLVRFYDPQRGSVRIDGVDVADIDDTQLRSAIMMVDQRSYLFNGTIADNLRLAAPGATDAELTEACAQAALDLAGFPHGLRTELGEQGSAVSGGQRQRIALARAFLRNAPILVLDEVTSQLDAATEAALTSALERIQEGRTTIAIAHRLSTIKNANSIVVMDAGRVVATGTHAKLLATSDHYRALMRRDREDLPD